MNTILKLLICCVLFLSQLPTLFAFQPSGGVLALDGVDDYAVLSLKEHGYLIPKNSREFTVEMWVYPKAQAKEGEVNVILSQQVAFGSWPYWNPWFKFKEDNVDNVYIILMAFLQGGGGVHGTVSFSVTLHKNQWSYLALILKDGKVGAAWNQMITGRNTVFGDRVVENLNMVAVPKDFFVGGYAQVLEEWNVPQFNLKLKLEPKRAYFQGYIDAIRISEVARYKIPAQEGVEQSFDPPHRFEVDKQTLALWDFDDGEGATRFSDSSSLNRHTLIGKNGAQVRKALSVNPSSSIPTTWGKIKYR